MYVYVCTYEDILNNVLSMTAWRAVCVVLVYLRKCAILDQMGRWALLLYCVAACCSWLVAILGGSGIWDLQMMAENKMAEIVE